MLCHDYISTKFLSAINLLVSFEISERTAAEGRVHPKTATIRTIPINAKNALCFPSGPVVFYTSHFLKINPVFVNISLCSQPIEKAVVAEIKEIFV